MSPDHRREARGLGHGLRIIGLREGGAGVDVETAMIDIAAAMFVRDRAGVGVGAMVVEIVMAGRGGMQVSVIARDSVNDGDNQTRLAMRMARRCRNRAVACKSKHQAKADDAPKHRHAVIFWPRDLAFP